MNQKCLRNCDGTLIERADFRMAFLFSDQVPKERPRMNSASRTQELSTKRAIDSRLLSVRHFAGVEPKKRDDLDDELKEKLIGNSEVMRALRRSIQILARSDETVLITGETGTGKELIARAIHDVSPRKTKPFLAVNCGALSESILESELFGHVKGAFTGAVANKKGFFEAANSGTIFLDEFAEMSTQQRLLRVLQERTVRPVGSTDAREISIDTRVVVATHHDLQRDIFAGKFREDLYYRVNVLQIRSPAMRERHCDLLELSQHFIRRYNEKSASNLSEHVPGEVLEVLESYPWPGNVRELENVIKRMALYSSNEGSLSLESLAHVPELHQTIDTDPLINISEPQLPILARKLNFISKKSSNGYCNCTDRLNLFSEVINDVGGNIAKAARQLNIPRTTFRKQLASLKKRCPSG
jgi:transcriptional regulator with PAS, ATPase and Fis domain